MSLKTIIIYQNKILFNILNELYSEKFNIISEDEKNLVNLNFENNENNLIIVSHNNKNFKNQLIIKNFPLKIKKILDLININLSKKNYKTQSNIKIGSYILNLNSKKISQNDKKIFLTERESNLILFLKNSAKPANINQLQKEVWGHASELDTHTVETHIYRLRKKIKETFNDDSFINSTQEGYKIS